MILSKRLQAVADLLTRAGQNTTAVFTGHCMEIQAQCEINCVADVGTDHGYIPIYLVGQGICKKAIAMDIGRGPLERAVEHIGAYQLENYIQTRLSDGVKALETGEADAIVIAGMGGATMQGILEAGRDIITSQTILVLQPQSEVAEFRYYLSEQGYELLAEDMVCEDGKFYPMMKVKKGQQEAWGQSKLHMQYGPLLLQFRHPVLQEFLLWQREQKKKIIDNLRKNAGTETGNRRIREIEEELEQIKHALHMYKDV